MRHDRQARARTALAATAGALGGAAASAWGLSRRRRDGDVSLAALAATARTLPVGLVAFDECGRITLFSPQAERIFAYREAEIVGRPIDDLLPAFVRDRRGSVLERARGGDILGRRVEDDGLRSNGAVVPVVWTVTQLNERGPAAFAAYVLDISDQRRDVEGQRLL